MSNMENKIVLIGGGGHCKSVLDAALRSARFSEIAIVDPALPSGAFVLGCRVAGDDDILPTLREKGFVNAFITVGSIEDTLLRRKLVNKATAMGFQFPVIVDPSAVVSKSTVIGEGTFIGKNAVVNADALIGNHCILNTGSIVEHECAVGDFSHISIGVVLCGGVYVGKDAFIGAGTLVKQGMRIGDQSVIGIGSVVLEDIPSGLKAYGSPCRVIK